MCSKGVHLNQRIFSNLKSSALTVLNAAFVLTDDTLLILQQAERQLARPSGRYFGKRAIHELPAPVELAQMMDDIQRRLLR